MSGAGPSPTTRVGIAQLPPQQTQRTLIGQEVVRHEDEDGLAAGILLDHSQPDEWRLREIERTSRFPARRRQPFAVASDNPLECERHAVVHDLDGSLAVGSKRRTEQAMAGDDGLERRLQLRQIQWARHTEGADQVVGWRLWIELVYEPQAALPLAETGGIVLRSGRDTERTCARSCLFRLDSAEQAVGAVRIPPRRRHATRSRARCGRRVTAAEGGCCMRRLGARRDTLCTSWRSRLSAAED